MIAESSNQCFLSQETGRMFYLLFYEQPKEAPRFRQGSVSGFPNHIALEICPDDLSLLKCYSRKAA